MNNKTKTIILVLGVVLGGLCAVLLQYRAHIFLKLVPEIVTLKFWEAFISGFFFNWAFLQFPVMAFWATVIGVPIYVLLRAMIEFQD